jgi:hypothetical protein
MKFKVFPSGVAMHLFAKGKASWRIWQQNDREREKNSHTDRQAELSFLSRHLYSLQIFAKGLATHFFRKAQQ